MEETLQPVASRVAMDFQWEERQNHPGGGAEQLDQNQSAGDGQQRVQFRAMGSTGSLLITDEGAAPDQCAAGSSIASPSRGSGQADKLTTIGSCKTKRSGGGSCDLGNGSMVKELLSSRLSPAASELKRLASSYPLEKDKISRVKQLLERCTMEDLSRLGFQVPQPPKQPANLEKMPAKQRMKAIQAVITSLQYNHTGTNYFNVNKDRPFNRIMDTARDIMREALPIKCIEGAILGLYFTCGQEDLDRMALRFKTVAAGQVYRHIVLAVHHRPTSTWGALGLSRRKELMYKELRYSSLSELVTDFKESYEGWWHAVHKIRIGLPAEHNLHYTGRVNWCFTVAKPQTKTWDHWCCAFETHAKKMHKATDVWRQLGADAQREGRQGVQWTAYRNASLNPTRAKNLPRTIGSPYEQCKSSKLKASGKTSAPEKPSTVGASEPDLPTEDSSDGEQGAGAAQPARPGLRLPGKSPYLRKRTPAKDADADANGQGQATEGDDEDTDDSNEDSEEDEDELDGHDKEVGNPRCLPAPPQSPRD